jgi:hypothetical protein
MSSTKRTLVSVAILLLVLVGTGTFATFWHEPDSKTATVVSRPVPGGIVVDPGRGTITRAPRDRVRQSDTDVAVAAPDPSAVPAATETPQQKLDHTVLRVDWNGVPLGDALGELSDRTGVEIVVSPEVLDGRRDEDLAIERLNLGQPVSARQILDLVTLLRGLNWTVDGPRVVVLVSGAKLDPATTPIALKRSPPRGPVTVSGRVTDASGAAVSGAQVVQVTTQTSLAVTDANGRYEATLQRPYGSIGASLDGFVPSRPAPFAGTRTTARTSTSCSAPRRERSSSECSTIAAPSTVQS